MGKSLSRVIAELNHLLRVFSYTLRKGANSRLRSRVPLTTEGWGRLDAGKILGGSVNP